MRFRVRLLKAAQADAEEIFERVVLAAPMRGPQWYKKLMASIESLTYFPQRCGHAPENAHFDLEIRHLLFGRKPNVTRILFTLEGDTVVVLRIRGPRQQVIDP